MATQIITVESNTWTLISAISGVFQSIANHTFYSFESTAGVPTQDIKRLASKSGTGPYLYEGGNGDLYIYSKDRKIFIQFDEQTTPMSVVVGSGSAEWENVGELTLINAIALGGQKETEMAALTAGSFLKFSSLAGAMFAMTRWRLDDVSDAMVVSIYGSKPEKDASGSSFERVYDLRGVVSISTTGTPLAAERGGYFADAAVISGDETLKGIAEKGTKIKTDSWDSFTEDEFYIVCTTAPTTKGYLDKSSA